MDQTWKRLLSAVMALTMLFGMLVFPAGAAELEEPPVETAAEEAPAETIEEIPEETQQLTEAVLAPEEETPSDEAAAEEVQTITADGEYTFPADFSGTVVIAPGVTEVTIVGSGDESQNIRIDCTAAPGVTLTLQNISISGAEGNLIDFAGAGNTLVFDGNVTLGHDGGAVGYAAIHCPEGGELTLSGTAGSQASLKKSGSGAGIGGNYGELSGGLFFGLQEGANDFYLSVKGTGEGAVIGSDADTPCVITFRSGIYDIAGKGLLLGGNVCVNGGLISLNAESSGAAADGESFCVTGGSIRACIGSEVSGDAIASEMVNGDGEAVYLLKLEASPAERYTIAVDGIPYYQGAGYADAEGCFWLFVTGKDHTVAVNDEETVYYWDALEETFHTQKHANVTFFVDVEDADMILSDGIGYTYLEKTHEGYFFEAVEAVEPDEEAGIEGVEAKPARTMYSLAPGEYSFTITCEGYYASSGSFLVSEDGHAVSVGSSTNINSYMKDDIFTIPMTPFTPSTNAGAWDGVTLDVSWYDENASELHITTPAQLAGMAAIINGIYNAETTAIIDDVDGDGVTETYTPYDYAHLERRKIIAACSEGDTSGPNGGNLVTTSTYWYGAKSEGTFYHTSAERELPLPADFNGVTVYLDCDLDMGGYQVDGTWTGARYMTIGGQSLMHYIDYGKWVSDGYSHIGSSFNGTLDGQGHIVYNLYCDRYATGSNYGDSVSVGLVGRMGVHDSDPEVLYAENPTVRNVAVAGYVYGRRSVGGIVGKTGKSYGTLIENCLNFAQIRNTDSKGVGGICGAGWNIGTIRNCANFGSVYAAYKNAGGISGSCEQKVINCYNVGYVGAADYRQSQSIGTNNGGASYTNVYWLTGSSLSDSVEGYQYPAVYGQSKSDTLVELTTYGAFTTDEFLKNLNGDSRAWAFAAESNFVSSFQAAVSFQNSLLDTAGITAAGMPVPRCFIIETATVVSVEKLSDPETLSYVEGQSFDPTGLKIVAYWSDGTSEVLEGYTLSIDRPLEAEDTAVTVSGTVGGKAYSYEFAITVEKNELTALQITSKPSSILYAQGESFDPTGMIVKAIYSAAPTTKVTLSAEEYTCTVENGVVTVSYTFGDKTLTASFKLTLLDTPAPSLNAEGFYELTCSNDLLWFANQVKGCKRTDINAAVMNDIAVDSSFPGIGSYGAKYAGIFDGGGYTLTLDMKVSGSAGLILCASGATVRNVTVDGSVTSTASSSGMAGIVGYMDGGPNVIENCTNKASLTGTGYVGGIVGKADGTQLTVTGCTNEGTITSSGKYAGGIAGYLASADTAQSSILVSDCINYGAVHCADAYSGGIAGSAVLAEIIRCGNEAAVTGLYDVGGILGHSQRSGDRISDCYNRGDITASGSGVYHGVGGIVGLMMGKAENVYNLGAVRTTEENEPETFGVGGIAGTIGSHHVSTNGVVNAYNAGTVSGSAIAGYVCSTSTLENCHYLEGSAETNLSGTFGTAAVNGKPQTQTHSALRALARTLGDAFKTDRVYPILQWQQSDFLLGDVNLDGAVDQSDVALLYAAVLEQETLSVKQLENGDVNLDSADDQSDVVLLLSYVLGQIPTL